MRTVPRQLRMELGAVAERVNVVNKGRAIEPRCRPGQDPRMRPHTRVDAPEPSVVERDPVVARRVEDHRDAVVRGNFDGASSHIVAAARGFKNNAAPSQYAYAAACSSCDDGARATYSSPDCVWI